MHHESVRIPRSCGEHGVFSEVSDEFRGLRSNKGPCLGFHFPPKNASSGGARVGRHKGAQRTSGETRKQCWNSTGSTGQCANDTHSFLLHTLLFCHCLCIQELPALRL